MALPYCSLQKAWVASLHSLLFFYPGRVFSPPKPRGAADSKLLPLLVFPSPGTAEGKGASDMMLFLQLLVGDNLIGTLLLEHFNSKNQ